MSANNIVMISKANNRYLITDEDIESEEGMGIGIEHTLEEAVKRAEKYCQENIVEYGIRFRFDELNKKGDKCFMIQTTK